MKRIPDSREVDRALKAVRSALKRSITACNQSAAQQMAKGRYEDAEEIIARARRAKEFQTEVDALWKRWRDVSRGDRGKGEKAQATPLWVYYQPILKALVEAGGEMRRVDLEPMVERHLGETIQAADREELSRGLRRWQVMIRRARKHLVGEGWIEDGSGPLWRITDAGRRAASSPIKPGRTPTQSPGSPRASGKPPKSGS